MESSGRKLLDLLNRNSREMNYFDLPPSVVQITCSIEHPTAPVARDIRETTLRDDKPIR